MRDGLRPSESLRPRVVIPLLQRIIASNILRRTACSGPDSSSSSDALSAELSAALSIELPRELPNASGEHTSTIRQHHHVLQAISAMLARNARYAGYARYAEDAERARRANASVFDALSRVMLPSPGSSSLTPYVDAMDAAHIDALARGDAKPRARRQTASV